MIPLLNVDDYEHAAREQLEALIYDYIAGDSRRSPKGIAVSSLLLAVALVSDPSAQCQAAPSTRP